MNFRLLLPLLLAAACTPTSDALSDVDRQAVADEIRAANVALLGALNAHDADGVLALYESGAHFQYVGCTQVIQSATLFQNIVRGYHRSRPDVTYEMAVIGLVVLDRDNGVATLRGESDALELFTTRVWRRGADDAWKVAYEHESWPGCSPPQLPHPGMTPDDSTLLAPPTTGP